MIITLGCFRVLVAGVILALLSAGAAQAETRVPYRTQLSKQCDGELCSLQFPVIPANRRVELESLSCFTTVINGALIAIFIRTNPAPILFHYPSQRWVRLVSSLYEYTSISEPTGLFVTAGQRLIVEAQSKASGGGSGAVFVTCAFYGEWVVLP